MAISSKTPDDRVGSAHVTEGLGQTPEQAKILGSGGEAGIPEPKGAEDWAARGAVGGTPGRAPVAVGGNSQGQGDKAPAGGATVANVRAPDPKPADQV